MTGYLLDTNVVSEITRPNPDQRVRLWLGSTPRERTFLSVLTIGEIRKGAALATDASRRARIESWLNEALETAYKGRILTVDAPVALRWGEVTAARQRSGRPLPVTDGLIAATALEHNLTVATRNTPDFDIPGLKLINPWDA